MAEDAVEHQQEVVLAQLALIPFLLTYFFRLDLEVLEELDQVLLDFDAVFLLSGDPF